MLGVNVRGYSRGIPTIRTQQTMREHPEETLLVWWIRDGPKMT